MNDDVKRALERAYWAEYGELMESIRRGERLAYERWGRVRGGVMPRYDAVETSAMRQLRMGLDSYWVGFEDGGE